MSARGKVAKLCGMQLKMEHEKYNGGHYLYFLPTLYAIKLELQLSNFLPSVLVLWKLSTLTKTTLFGLHCYLHMKINK